MSSLPMITTVPAADIARIEQLAALTIGSPAAEKEAIDNLAFVRGVKKALEKGQKDALAPLKVAADKLKTSYAEMLGPVTARESAIEATILTWRAAERKRIADEQARVDRENRERERLALAESERIRKEAEATATAEAAAAGFTAAEVEEYAASEVAEVAPVTALQEVAPATPLKTTQATLGSATSRMVMDYEITDAAAVPHEYRTCEPSRGKIRDRMNGSEREWLLASGGRFALPGVRFFEREDLAVKKL